MPLPLSLPLPLPPPLVLPPCVRTDVLLSVVIGFVAANGAGKSASSYFLAGKDSNPIITASESIRHASNSAGTAKGFNHIPASVSSIQWHHAYTHAHMHTYTQRSLHSARAHVGRHIHIHLYALAYTSCCLHAAYDGCVATEKQCQPQQPRHTIHAPCRK